MNWKCKLGIHCFHRIKERETVLATYHKNFFVRKYNTWETIDKCCRCKEEWTQIRKPCHFVGKAPKRKDVKILKVGAWRNP